MERFIIPSIILGAISGVIFGILLLIPFIAPFMFFLMFLLAGVFVIVVLKQFRNVGLLNIYDGCFIGSIAGFISLITASALYLPITFFIGGYISLHSYDILATLMLVFSTGILSSLFNAFTGLVTAYIYEKIDSKTISFQDHFDLEIEKGSEEL